MSMFISLGVTAAEVFCIYVAWHSVHWSVAFLLTLHFLRDLLKAIYYALAEAHAHHMLKTLLSETIKEQQKDDK